MLRSSTLTRRMRQVGSMHGAYTPWDADMVSGGRRRPGSLQAGSIDGISRHRQQAGPAAPRGCAALLLQYQLEHG